MANQLQPIVLRDYQNGMNSSVCNALLPSNYLRQLNNCYTDESAGNHTGNIRSNPGYTIIGSAIESGKDILGLTNFYHSTPRLIATVNNAGDTNALTYYWTGAAWAEVGAVPVTWTANAKMRFAYFLDLVFAANGVDSIQTWDGDTATSWGTTQAVSAPVGNLITNFGDRMIISGNSTFPDRLYYSSFPATADGSITWSVNNWVGVDHTTNEEITALEENGSNLLAFKRRKMFAWNGYQIGRVDGLTNVGAISQEVVQTINGITFFFGERCNSGSIFIYTGSYPQPISGGIKDWIDAIDTANYSSFGSWQDDENYYLSVGDVTKGGVTYSNLCFRYNIAHQSWSTMTLPTKPLMGATRVDGSENRTVVMGDDNGSVYTMNSGTTYNGSPINAYILTKELEFGSRRKRKTLSQITAYSENPAGAVVRARKDGGKWEPIGTLTKKVQPIKCNLNSFYYLELSVSSANSNEPMEFDGFEIEQAHIKKYD